MGPKGDLSKPSAWMDWWRSVPAPVILAPWRTRA
jgi:hypothetical protein